LLRALGATPLHVANADIPRALASRSLDGEELSLANAPIGGIVTGNVTFFGKAITLFASREADDRLGADRQALLREAARQTVSHLLAQRVTESALARGLCRGAGRLVLASPRERAALERAARPVYRELQRDPTTRSLIGRIRSLDATAPPAPKLIVPAGCSALGNRVVVSKPRPASILDGTYHLVFTRAAALAFGRPATDPENDRYPTVETRILDNGKSLWGGGDRGTYAIHGSTVTFSFPGSTAAESFTFTLDRHGTLRLRPVLPMDPGDQWVTAGVPWHRVGPPTKSLG